MGRSAREIIDALYQALREFSGSDKHPDDVTAVISKVERES
ncbi:MAG: hypothetical protein ACYTG0_41610 [Planctomycetota bacterium]